MSYRENGHVLPLRLSVTFMPLHSKENHHVPIPKLIWHTDPTDWRILEALLETQSFLSICAFFFSDRMDFQETTEPLRIKTTFWPGAAG